MKLSAEEKKTLSSAIDKLNEGLDEIIALYNEAEEDRPFIQFEPVVMESIEKAKETFGEEEISRRINTIIKEVFSFLPTTEKSTEESE
ncbi:atypical membrane-integrating protein (Mistic protein) [Litchfieldia salsa]|uniref:Membrane-integrating protein Mistic n=1 Tax=Litchfieldia salsa TaxID=930152 RepID=A0A1H0WYF5_9BACI|nr:atypical membrane-integrating protein (Mistic protein) [Litchfieldia salsa]SDP95741.1 Membrane-integrating protein Mistic [Litchfieldia salsa]